MMLLQQEPCPACPHHDHRGTGPPSEHCAGSSPKQPSTARIVVKLLDVGALVPGRPPIKLGVKTTSNLSRVAAFLKRKFDRGVWEIPCDGKIDFFRQGKLLREDELPGDGSTLWYRVIAPQDDGRLKLRWHGGDSAVCLSQGQLDHLAQCLELGTTVGQLRRSVASALTASPSSETGRAHAIEHDQVVVVALGGLRRGPVQGDNWICGHVKSWLCHELAISIVERDEYFVFHGFNERYVLHRPYLDDLGDLAGSALKAWLKLTVLMTVGRPGARPEEIRAEDISLFLDGRLVGDDMLFRPGVSVDFELRREAGDGFVDAEAWLLPPTETCSICTESKRVSEMPNRRKITLRCAHEATACKECVSQWISSSIGAVAWNRVKCPECPATFSFREVEAVSTRNIFNRFDRLATEAVLAGVEDFRWCLNPNCHSGQIYPPGCEKGRCHACQLDMCLHHDVPWHEGETCDQYQARIRRQLKNDKRSEDYVRRTTKPCPDCKKDVQKSSGCDHMTCACGHEWCWQCLGPYTGFSLGCRHAPDCPHRRMMEGRRERQHQDDLYHEELVRLHQRGVSHLAYTLISRLVRWIRHA